MAGEQGLLLTINSKHDHEYSVRLIRWILTPLGVWPRSGISTLSRRIFSAFAILLSSFLISFMLMPYVLCLAYDDQACADLAVWDCGLLSYCLIGGIKYYSLLCHVNDIRRCVDHMETDWKMIKKPQDREVMLESAKMGRLIALICTVFLHSGAFSYDIIIATTKSVKVIGNETISTRILPYIFHDKLWDAEQSPAYEVAFALQILSTFVINSVMAGSCGLAAVFVMHARGQLRILVSLFDDLMDGNRGGYNNVERRLAVVVNHHSRVFRFSTAIEEILNIICLGEIMGGTVLMCVIGYCGITEWSMGQRENILSYCCSFLGVAFNIFVYCYIGEVLYEESILIGQTAYMTEWYRLSSKTAVSLVLVILRSRYAIRITAGKTIQLSLATFTNVLTTSLTYFNMLRTVIQRTE